VVVVTGGARGMGRAYARAFLSEGAKVALADRTWAPYADVEDGVSAFKEELRSHADRALRLEMDVTSDQQIDRAYHEVLARFGTVDVLINNAAMRPQSREMPYMASKAALSSGCIRPEASPCAGQWRRKPPLCMDEENVVVA
jgi:NAD(P)-dependent dehydrogenase (short-subunit alcohol dehydrogenase family)